MANAIVGVAAVILMTPGVVYQTWHGDEKAEVGYCQVTVILSLTLPVEKPLRSMNVDLKAVGLSLKDNQQVGTVLM